MLKKRYIFDVGVCKLYEFYSDVVDTTHRLYSFGFPQQNYIAYYQNLYDGQYSLVVGLLPPYYMLLQNNNYIVYYISFTFGSWSELMTFLRYMFMPLVSSFRKVCKYKRKTLNTKQLIYNYKKNFDYATTFIE